METSIDVSVEGMPTGKSGPRWMVGRQLLLDDKAQEAIAYLAAADGARPLSGDEAHYLGRAYLACGDAKRAAHWLKWAVTHQCAEAFWAFRFLGSAYDACSSFEAAIESWSAALGHCGDDWGLAWPVVNDLLDSLGQRNSPEERRAVIDALRSFASQQLAIFGARPRGETYLSDNGLLGLHRQRLKSGFGTIEIVTDHPVAVASPDHQSPWGTAHDNSRNPRFNSRLISLIPDSQLSVLDLGCSGGGMVRSFIEQGYLAVGIEGSDYSLLSLRAEWNTIPDFLFTADITKPFRLYGRSHHPLRFGIVTLWEVIEHIAEPDLSALLSNVDLHLAPGGILILSVSSNEEIVNGLRLHQTVQPREWWKEFLLSAGWINHPRIVSYFRGDFVRDEINAPGSFHFVLSRRGETPALNAATRYLANV